MPLTLITGPAHAAHGAAVFAALRAVTARRPLLVVPTIACVDRCRRELVVDRAVFGATVITFAELIDLIGNVGGGSLQRSGRTTRLLIAEAAIAATALDRLAAAAQAAGFAPALTRLADELTALRVDPQRLAAALKASSEDRERRSYYAELTALIAADSRLSASIDSKSDAAYAIAVLDALRLQPGRWGGRPVFFYGFDDLTAIELDAVETLAKIVKTDVTVALMFEVGRQAYAARAGLYEQLRALGAQEQILPPLADLKQAVTGSMLKHLERNLWAGYGQQEDGGGEPQRSAGEGGGVRALIGGDERAELELAAADIARAIAAGTDPDQIVVVHRGLDSRVTLVRRVFAEAGVPIALTVGTQVGVSVIGRALVSLLRCALGGTAADLVTYLRAACGVRAAAGIDRFEHELRRSGIDDLERALARWEREQGPLAELVALTAASSSGDLNGVLSVLDGCATELLTGPRRGLAARLDGEIELDARTVAAIRKTLADIGQLPPELDFNIERLPTLIAQLKVTIGGPAAAGEVVITGPQDLSMRTVQRLYCLGLQQDVFPQAERPDPLLDDRARAAANVAGGLRLPLSADGLDSERLLFYTVVSHPTAELVLGWHEADEDAGPSVRSLFIDDVAALLPDGWMRQGAAGWPPELAPTTLKSARYRAVTGRRRRPQPTAIAPLSAATARALLDARPTFSASGLEAWLSCPVRWFVERQLKPLATEPDPEHLVRGELAHRVLEQAIMTLVRRPGGLPQTTATERRELTVSVLKQHAEQRPLTFEPERLKAELRRLEVELVAYVEALAASGSEFKPTLMEVGFGRTEDEYPVLELGAQPGELPIAGKIDRIDIAPAGKQAIIYDYKGRTKPVTHSHWQQEGRLQPVIYLLAACQLLELDVVGSFYQPLGGSDVRPRGMLLEDADPELELVAGDRIAPEALEQLVDDLRARAHEAADGIRAGRLEPCPERCGPTGTGCAYPTICRCLKT